MTEVTAEPGAPAGAAGRPGRAQTDFAAVYLALAAGVDPLTSPHVADLRDRTR